MAEPVLFPIPPHGAAQVLERVAYQTDVLQADGGSEQRLRLRRNPILSMDYTFRSPDTLAGQLARNLLMSDPEPGFLVPWWPHLCRIGAAAAAGATVLSADLTGVPLAIQSGQLRWVVMRSPFEYELLDVADVYPSVLELNEPTVAAWDAGCALVPVLAAHLSAPPSLERLTRDFSGASVRFVADLVTDYRLPTGADIYTPAGYLGLDVLTAFPTAPGATDTLVRRTSTHEADAGGVAYESPDAAGGLSRAVAYRCGGRMAVLSLRRFFAARAGRLNPFWAPTGDNDLTLAAGVTAGDGVLPVYDTAYTPLLDSAGNSRRHLAYRTPAGAIECCEIGGPGDMDGGVAGLDMWTPGLPSANLVAGTPLWILRHCRLAEDALELNWQGLNYAEAKLAMLELASDCPTGVLT